MFGGERGLQRCCVAVLVAVVLAAGAVAHADAPAPSTTASQAMPDRGERLVGLAKLWTRAKYFHPQLAYKPIDWDAALIAAIPKVEAATTLAMYRAALQDMLARLGDPVTRMIDPPAVAAARAPSTTWLAWPVPGVLDVQIAGITSGGYDYVAFGAKAKQVSADAAKAKVMVIDLRMAGGESWLAAAAVDRFHDALPAIDAWPLQRTVEHRGFRTQHGQTSGGYYSTFVTSGALPAKPAPSAGPRHVVFVADARSALPAAAIALQAAGRATIVSAGPLSEESVVATDEIELPGGLRAQLRLGELWWGPPAADVRVAPTADPHARALAIAKARLAKPGAATPRPRKLRALPPMSARDDRDYAEQPYPTRERRVLAGIRIWGTLEHFFPYRYLVADWDGALRDVLPKLEAAKDRDAYLHALRELGVRAGDGHIGVFPAAPDPKARPRGIAPVVPRLVEGKPVIVRVVDAAEAKRAGIAVGDVIETVDREPVVDVIAKKRAVVSGSTAESRDQRIASALLTGEDGTRVTIGIRAADGKRRDVTLTRKAAHFATFNQPSTAPHWKKLPGNIGYVDLTQLVVPEVGAMFSELAGTKAIIFDMRGYPNGTAWSIAPRVNTKGAKHGAQFLQPLVAGGAGERNDTRIRFLQHIPELPPGATLYRGRIVVLIDDRAISQAEHTCLFLQETAGAIFVGTPTAGANGDVTVMRLPGGLRMGFTGQEVRHVDGKQLQKLGIQPHVVAAPTLAGVRAGKDEVLDRALAYLATGK